ncbi:Fic/DOC family protein [Cronobacter dublinensis]|uniref:Fic/DOC family protein n=2 Tax=Cronobacter dublinensis TaxID=413497 RepID=UPI000CFAE385|nr:Fic family protein [Cronobacter dublinensis]EKY3087877.1 Fic family protein [Cronobacter dublinensis]ELQ6229036.1 Fic family protein [Cronobacter dublinensis]ELY4005236.1 Fic family protein [Cronobacter dublinensis]ELY4407629.1 Fic family protein [Cronobacter dublinensis]ELY5817874.1 Fic family protein [Cronobacter dublinensis]
MIFDPFGDFETAGYLQNTLGLKNPDEVKRSEHLVFELGIEEALQFLSSQASITYATVLRVHAILFAEFYPWAGRDRNELVPDLAVFKGTSDHPRHTVFAHPKEIKLAVNYALQLACDIKRFRKRPGEVMGALAFAHPFLDGNGRALLLVFMELSYRAGFSIAWYRTNKDDYLNALSVEIAEPARRCLDKYLLPFMVDITDRDEWPGIIGGIKGLDGLDKEDISYRSLDDPEIQNLYRIKRDYGSETGSE